MLLLSIINYILFRILIRKFFLDKFSAFCYIYHIYWWSTKFADVLTLFLFRGFFHYKFLYLFPTHLQVNNTSSSAGMIRKKTFVKKDVLTMQTPMNLKFSVLWGI